VKEQNDGMTGLCRHVPDDHPLAIRGKQKLLFSLGQTRGCRRRAEGLRNGKDERTLLEKQHGNAAEISNRGDKRDPFQDGQHVRQVMGSWRARHIPLTMFSVIFLASPSNIIVLSR
jgi:hypothetical protein